MSYVRVRVEPGNTVFVRLPLSSATPQTLGQELVRCVGPACLNKLVPDPPADDNDDAAAASPPVSWWPGSEADVPSLVGSLRFTRVSGDGAVSFHETTPAPPVGSPSSSAAGGSTSSPVSDGPEGQRSLSQLGIEHCQLLVLQRKAADGQWCFLRQ